MLSKEDLLIKLNEPFDNYRKVHFFLNSSPVIKKLIETLKYFDISTSNESDGSLLPFS